MVISSTLTALALLAARLSLPVQNARPLTVWPALCLSYSPHLVVSVITQQACTCLPMVRPAFLVEWPSLDALNVLIVDLPPPLPAFHLQSASLLISEGGAVGHAAGFAVPAL